MILSNLLSTATTHCYNHKLNEQSSLIKRNSNTKGGRTKNIGNYWSVIAISPKTKQLRLWNLGSQVNLCWAPNFERHDRNYQATGSRYFGLKRQNSQFHGCEPKGSLTSFSFKYSKKSVRPNTQECHLGIAITASNHPSILLFFVFPQDIALTQELKKRKCVKVVEFQHRDWEFQLGIGINPPSQLASLSTSFTPFFDNEEYQFWLTKCAHQQQQLY